MKDSTIAKIKGYIDHLDVIEEKEGEYAKVYTEHVRGLLNEILEEEETK